MPTHMVYSENDSAFCQNVVQKWAAASLAEEVKEVKYRLLDFLFFLHVPRTGGRTYYYCFLMKLYTSYLGCPRSYDKLRFDPRKLNCRLMATHDDYSLMNKLPKERTSVVTILRNPIDRVFSTYEFSVEVAARFLVHPNLASATQMTRRTNSSNDRISTLDIWPWKYLVPWMREDLFARRDRRRKYGHFTNIKARTDSYNMEDIVMPLQKFIKNPIAQEIIHNGATFQVAGLTNNSYLTESHEIRHCVKKYQALGKYVLDVAKKRLNEMLYVGLTEEHKESTTMFADVVGMQVLSLLQTLSSQSEQKPKSRTELSNSFSDSAHESYNFQNNTDTQKGSRSGLTENARRINDTISVGKLMESYEGCISGLRNAQTHRRTSSLKQISPVNFSKEARLQVPEEVLQQIISYNNLDVKLYKHAQDIFAQRRKQLIEKLIEEERENNGFNNLYGYSTMVVVLSLLMIAILLINLRRRKSKPKLQQVAQ
ncbi:hypothetical protein Scep_014875 [Stephania cephalantha]|uniref:Sulfotransferase n=1 Tax=Stephania cephalantha TaxID=152367 RepID=A0AAP0J232_9MAGN